MHIKELSLEDKNDNIIDFLDALRKKTAKAKN